MYEHRGPIPGELIEEWWNANQLAEFLDDVPAVYFWARKLSPTSVNAATQLRFVDWLEDELAKTQGVVEDSVKHMGRVRIEYGGAHLSAEKKAAIAELASTLEMRKAFQNLLRVFDYSLIMYVGETSSLVDRVRDHVSGATDFSQRLKKLDYKWSSMGLRYFTLPTGTQQSHRQALERALAILSLAPATSRAG